MLSLKLFFQLNLYALKNSLRQFIYIFKKKKYLFEKNF
jgi:hypothetical protein